MTKRTQEIVWWIGAAAWLLDAGVSLRISGRTHALIALGIAVLFAVMAVYTSKTSRR
jgi:hypothetical protein